MGDLSPHFSRSEFRCHGFGHPGHPDHDTPVDEGLVQLLELIRAEHGAPVRVVSGHRCDWWNRRVGGARLGQHRYGKAADLEPGVITPDRANKLGAMGIGVKRVGGTDWATHVDRRTRKARWRYN